MPEGYLTCTAGHTPVSQKAPPTPNLPTVTEKQVLYKSVTSCIPKDKDNTCLLTFMDNIIHRALKLNAKVNPLYIVDLIGIWRRGLKAKAKIWALN